MKTWTEQPAEADVEDTVRRYFEHLRARRIPEAEQLVDHTYTSVRHVLESLWSGSVEADGIVDGEESPFTAGEWERDFSWLDELALADFSWGHTGSHVYVTITYHERVIEVALSFWIKPTTAGWHLSGPSTLW
ncbi:hypothetical protein [Streptomyces liangshanensis]|uniref:hypothetical protein n=1 Tax=Streptomyces liangshanensis TaxID=2717324 RepID=UPI0036DD6DCD